MLEDENQANDGDFYTFSVEIMNKIVIKIIIDVYHRTIFLPFIKWSRTIALA